MIKRFIKINNNLFRGGKPSVKDVIDLQKNYNIKQIISLDEIAGNEIKNICKFLNIKHIIIPINGTDLFPIVKLLSYDLNKLLIDNGPTFVHCQEGKDRTGMLIAMFKCKYMGYDYKQALNEAIKLGFGYGLNPRTTKMYKKIIAMFCDCNSDNNSAKTPSVDIVENMKNQQSDHYINLESIAPFLDPTRQYPNKMVYNYRYEDNSNQKINIPIGNGFPMIGYYDNNAGIKGVGPVDNTSGFVNI